MIQYICNRCRKKLSDYEVHEVFVTHRDDHSEGEDDDCFHLCRSCRQRLNEFMNGKTIPGFNEDGEEYKILPYEKVTGSGTGFPLYDGDYPSSFCEVVAYEDADSGANANYVEVDELSEEENPLSYLDVVDAGKAKKVFEPRYVGDIAEGPRDSCYVGDSE